MTDHDDNGQEKPDPEDELNRKVGEAFAKSIWAQFQMKPDSSFPFISRPQPQQNAETVLTYDAIKAMLDALPTPPKKLLYFINIDDAVALFRMMRKSGFKVVRQRSIDGHKRSMFAVMDGSRVTGEIYVDQFRRLARGKVAYTEKTTFADLSLRPKIRFENQYEPKPLFFGRSRYGIIRKTDES